MHMNCNHSNFEKPLGISILFVHEALFMLECFAAGKIEKVREMKLVGKQSGRENRESCELPRKIVIFLRKSRAFDTETRSTLAHNIVNFSLENLSLL